MMDQGKFTGAGILAVSLVVPALVTVGPALAVICATIALECILGALYVGKA